MDANGGSQLIVKLKSPYLIEPGKKVRLTRLKTDEDGGFQSKEEAAPVLVKHRERLAEMQELFWASRQKALLIVLQGMDTAGKDGTISHIFSGVNPQGCNVASFKVPTPVELEHDFLWRVHAAVPPRGMIQIFNRSHYEDVLAPRVHKLISEKVVQRRIDDINRFERTLADNDVVILKFFLNISKQEQTRRLEARIDTPDKHWKLSPADFKEREYWNQYIQAYNEVLSETSTKHAPWFAIPSDVKWYRNIAISEIIVQAMKGMKLEYPKPVMDVSKIKL
jgi:PPK2 family polyphosphate:nucleotide phosphotransferase